MLKKTFTCFFLISCFSFIIPVAHSKPINMRPGLWELKTTSELLKLAPLIPSEQMQYMQEIANEYGLEMPNIQNGAAISRTCVTPEMAAQQVLPKLYQDELGCISDAAKRNGNNYQIHFTCNSSKLKGEGVAQGIITSTESFTGHSEFKGNVQGNPINERADISGKWIGASCNNH